jgi:metal-responsive CopG/Arc/MetJ family transcriptional regulator
MGTSTKNVTFSLPIELIEKLRSFANNHYIPSVSAGVREALEDFIRELEKDMLKKKMIEASKDPAFMQDLNESMNAFEHSDKETFGGTEEW